MKAVEYICQPISACKLNEEKELCGSLNETTTGWNRKPEAVINEGSCSQLNLLSGATIRHEMRR